MSRFSSRLIAERDIPAVSRVCTALEAFAGAGHQPRFGHRDGDGFKGRNRWRLLYDGFRRFGVGLRRCRRDAQAPVVGAHGLAHHLAQVLPEVEAISHLNCIWCSGLHALGVGAGPVSADDFDAGMFDQPRGQGGSLAVREQVNGPMISHIDQDGAIGLGSPEGEIIDLEHPHHRRCRNRLGTDQADQPPAAR
jgi:hypothetical protein